MAKKIYKFIILILWILLVFLFSNESSTVSSGRSNIIIDLINPIAFNISENTMIFIVRKLAHMFIYFVLGILIFNVLSEYKFSKKKLALCSISLTLACATIDEIHQLFISGRSGQPRDVLIDMIGGLIGIGLCSIFIELKINKNTNKPTRSVQFNKIANYAITVILVLSFLSAMASIIGIKIIPNKYLIIAVILSTIITATLVTLNYKNKLNSTKKSIILFTLSIAASVSFLYINSICNNVYSFLGNIQDTNYSYETYSVITKNDYNVDLKMNNKSIGMIKDDSNKSELLRLIKLKTTATAKESSELTSLTSELNNRKVDTIILKNSYLSLLDENYNEFYKNIKVLCEFKIKTKNTSSDKDTDTTKPFIVYISGIDTYGEVTSVARSDVNILAVVNPIKNKILLVNTPRDYYIQLHGTTGTRDKLTHAGIYGIEMSKATLEDLYGVNINYYIRVNFTSLLSIIDTLGGIEVYSDYSFKTNNYSFKEGYNQLDAKQALEFSRERYAFEEGDRTRGRNQQRVIEAIISKSSNPTELLKYQNILKSLGKTIQTNASRDEITSLLNQQMNTLKKWQTESISVTGSGKTSSTYSMGSMPLYVMEPDLESLYAAKSSIQTYLE